MTKKQKLFVLISAVFILGCIGFYGYRLIHYYRIEHPKGEPAKYQSLYDTLLVGQDNLEGLYKDDKSYYYKGNVTNNYLLYAGRLWRIVSLDEEHNIRIITEDIQTILSYGGDYKKSYIHKWLNPNPEDESHDSFYQTLNSENLIYSTIYIDQIDNINTITHKKGNDDLVGLLSLYEYNKAGGKESYLNNDTEWWLSSTTTDGKAWYVLKNNVAKVDYTSFANKGIRPVVTLNFNTVVTSGTGSKEEPFKIEEKIVKEVSELYVGERIVFNNQNWKIMKQEEDKTKIVLEGLIETNKTFSTTNNTYDITDKKSLAYYLNYSYYETLSNKDYIKEGEFFNGSYGIELNYDYETVKESVFTANVGTLAIGDIFISDYPNIFLMNHSNSSKLVYTISSEKMIYEDDVNADKPFRPVIYLDNRLTITEGDGFKEPYAIGGIQNEEG